MAFKPIKTITVASLALYPTHMAIAARMKTAKPEELFAVLEAIDDWDFHKGVACALLDTVADEQELDEIESYLTEWVDEQELAEFAKDVGNYPVDIALPVGKK